MKRLSVVLVAGAAWGSPLLGQGAFEGAVTYQLTDTAGKTITMVYQAKGSKIRMDMSGGEGMDAASPALIYDESNRMVTAMIVQAHVYVATSMDSLNKPTGGKPVVKPTGAHETVAGVPCEDYLVTKDTRRETICAAHGMGNFLLPGAGAGMGFETLMLPNGFFPLKVSAAVTGRPRVEMVATAVERKTVDPSIFAVPPDYKRLDAKSTGFMETTPPPTPQ
jgi:Domain of unknown function (DUF4412)